MKCMQHFLCLSFIAMCLAGCAAITGVGHDNAPPPTKLVSIKAPAFSPAVVWSKETGVGSEDAHLQLTPALADKHIFTVDVKGQVCSYNLDSGNASWCQTTKSAATTGLAVQAGVVTFGTKQGQVYALNQQNGRTLWTSMVPNQLLASPTLAQQRVYLKTVDGEVVALSACNGKQIWRYDHATPVYVLRDMSRPVVMGDRLIVGFSDGKLAAFRLDNGELLWEKTIATPGGRGLMDQLVDISADPVLDQGTLYVVTFQGNLAALNRVTGETRWEKPLSSYTGMVTTPRAVVVTDAEGMVWAFDKTDGHVLWCQGGLKYRDVTAPALQTCEFIVVADKKGYVHWLSTRNGEWMARIKVADEVISAAPLVLHNDVYVMTQKGKLFYIQTIKAS